MPDLGLEVLLKGKNAVRLLGGLWVALRVSLISVAISIPLGILLGVLMTRKNRLIRAILHIYLEIIRIMPQMVLLFLAYFGTLRLPKIEPCRFFGGGVLFYPESLGFARG